MDFNNYWTLIGGDTNFADRKAATEKAWHLCAPEKQQAIIHWLQTHGRYPGRNPYFFILDFQLKRRKIMSFNDYYAKYGTTLETNGWHMVKPQKSGDPPVYYVKY